MFVEHLPLVRHIHSFILIFVFLFLIYSLSFFTLQKCQSFGSTSFTLSRCGRFVHLTGGGTGRLFVYMRGLPLFCKHYSSFFYLLSS